MKDLIIFDYSGTLSLEAPRFGQGQRLVRELREAGLAELGIETPQLFWEEIVGPTWREGSTTQAGYEKVLVRRIAARMGDRAPAERIEKAAAAFVKRYLASCYIDPNWKGILKDLKANPRVLTLIATDHYAEATEAIRGYLRLWSIEAHPLARLPFADHGQAAQGGFLIANSADLGAWKEERGFWERVRASLSPQGPGRILVVDDFGGNEDTQDPYAAAEKIAARQEAMLTHLREVFQAQTEVICFSLGHASETGPAGLIGKTAARIRSFLGKEKAPG